MYQLSINHKYIKIKLKCNKIYVLTNTSLIGSQLQILFGLWSEYILHKCIYTNTDTDIDPTKYKLNCE